MTKSWETLLHLTNFMKYLLNDVLPYEKCSSPQSVLNSLLDLFKVTLDCVEIVRDNNKKDLKGLSKKTFHELLGNATDETVLLAKKTAKLVFIMNENNCMLTNREGQKINRQVEAETTLLPEEDEVDFIYSNDKQMVKNIKKKIQYNEPLQIEVYDNTEEKNIDKEADAYFNYKLKNEIPDINSQKLGNDSARDPFISSAFIEVHTKLITNTVNEGYYCGMCDENFFSNSQWLHHLQHHHWQVMETHISKCNICSLIICSSHVSRKYLISYHLKVHESENSLGYSKSTSPPSGLESLQDSNRNNFNSFSNVKLNSEFSSSNIPKSRKKTHNSSSYQPYNYKDFAFSDNFIRLNEDIHQGNTTEVYYCRPCDKAHYSLKVWEKHCMKRQHISFMGKKSYQNSQAKCTDCNMTMIGSKTVVIEYMKFHATFHDKVPSYELKLITDKDILQAKLAKHSNYRGSLDDQSLHNNSFSVKSNKENPPCTIKP